VITNLVADGFVPTVSNKDRVGADYWAMGEDLPTRRDLGGAELARP
jgi:hypothetical protein